MLLSVFLAALASFVLGALWYGPVFGRYWMGLMGFTPESMKAMPMTPLRAMTLGFAFQLVFAFVLSVFMEVSSVFSYTDAAFLAAIVWLGFYVTSTVGGYLWEGRSLKLVAFNAAYQLVNLLVASAVLVALA